MSVHVLGEVGIGSVEQFLEVFGTEGLAKRQEHGCRGTQVFAPVDAEGTVTVLLEFDDVAAFESFRGDATAGPIMRKGGATGPPTFRVLERVATYDA